MNGKGENNMTNLEAIEMRHSRRSYLRTPIATGSQKVLKAAIEKYNKISGLSIQFVENGSEAFKGFNLTYGMFHGIRSFFAMVGSTKDINLNEKIGYFGELLVLEATKLGLGTCWVGGAFNKKHCNCTVRDDETLVCVILVGNVEENRGFKEKTIYKLAHRGTKTIEQLYTSDEQAPDWFLEGIKAVQKAPSAINQQPVHFNYQSGIITASIDASASHRLIDLGIAKAHFDIATGGKFNFGNSAIFTKPE